MTYHECLVHQFGLEAAARHVHLARRPHNHGKNHMPTYPQYHGDMIRRNTLEAAF
jgi:hypothetical protein